MVRIAICEDDIPFSHELQKKISSKLEGNNIEYSLSNFLNGEDLIYKIDVCDQPFDVLFFDIQLPGMSGVEAARKIREQDKTTLFIFITCLNDEIYKILGLNIFNFIRKDYFEKEIDTVLNQLNKHCFIPFIIHLVQPIHISKKAGLYYFHPALVFDCGFVLLSQHLWISAVVLCGALFLIPHITNHRIGHPVLTSVLYMFALEIAQLFTLSFLWIASAFSVDKTEESLPYLFYPLNLISKAILILILVMMFKKIRTKKLILPTKINVLLIGMLLCSIASMHLLSDVRRKP